METEKEQEMQSESGITSDRPRVWDSRSCFFNYSVPGVGRFGWSHLLGTKSSPVSKLGSIQVSIQVAGTLLSVGSELPHLSMFKIQLWIAVESDSKTFAPLSR